MFHKGEKVQYTRQTSNGETVVEPEIGKVIGFGRSPELDENGKEIKDNKGQIVTFKTGYIQVDFDGTIHWCNPNNLFKTPPGL